jgi:hypothetical protein
LTPTVGRAVGEFEFMLKAGYRTFGTAAAHLFHHTPADPDMTGAEIHEPAGRALVRTLDVIEVRRTYNLKSGSGFQSKTCKVTQKIP